MSSTDIWESIATCPVPPIYRVRIVLEARCACQLPLLHGPIVYAMLCQANAHATNQAPAMPDGILPDIVEHALTQLGDGEPYALGLTVLGGSEHEAASRIDRLVAGLRHVGRHPLAKTLAFKRFDVRRVEDLVSGESFNGRSLTSIPHDAVVDQIDHLLTCGRTTIAFGGPLRTQRPKSRKADGHAYFDRQYFNPDLLISRLLGRLASLGFPELPKVKNVSVGMLENRLVWLDARYGAGKAKTLGGSVGTVTLENFDPLDAWALVWGQWVHVGENTRFGFGRYWLIDTDDNRGTDHGLRHPPWRVCERAEGLVRRSLPMSSIDQAASKWGIESGVLSAAVRDAIEGRYRCDPPTKIKIPKPGGYRELSIPSHRDRGLQRLLLERISPTLDECWEQAAVAYRRGLGRNDAARRVRQAYRNGYRWAIKSDFTEFFDRVNHQQLQERLMGYLGDRDLVELMMQLVASGSPSPTTGLPTGAPLSPLLANLFLDQFDEQIERAGGFLVRYADDFLILTKTQDEALAMLDEARQQAEQLGLELNRDKSRLFDLRHEFTFLGLRFQPGDQWHWDHASEPVLLEDPSKRVLRIGKSVK